MFEYDRFVLLTDDDGVTVAWIAAKTGPHGVKICSVAHNGRPEAKRAIVEVQRRGLNGDGVYAEVSDRVEEILMDHVPTVDATTAGVILGKPVTPLPDGIHYMRHITNVGQRQKVMVGRPRP